LKPRIARIGYPEVNIRSRNLSGGPERPGKSQEMYIDYPNIRRGDSGLG
jgi:hypothetical protein